jgi:hypothetical protein
VVALEQAGFPGNAHAAYETALGKWPDIREKSGHIQNDDDSGTISSR